jgi:hypothetical protein
LTSFLILTFVSSSSLICSFLTPPFRLLPPLVLCFPPLLGIAVLIKLFARLFAKGRARVSAFSFDIFWTRTIKATFVFLLSGIFAKRFPSRVLGLYSNSARP